MKTLEAWAKKIRKITSRHGFTCDDCGAEIFEYPHKRLCSDCENALVLNDGRVCDKCGRKTLAQGICLSCKATPPHFTYGVSPFVYHGEVASLINRLKNGKRRLSHYFGERSAECLLRRFPTLKTQFNRGRYLTNEIQQAESLLVLSVPLTKERVIKRGYNQSEALAEAIVEKLQSLGVHASTNFEALVKTRETTGQKDLDYQQRMQNAFGAYHVHKRKLCQGKTVLLVDDVMTTGATGSECARVLLNAGAKAVYFLVCAALPEKR